MNTYKALGRRPFFGIALAVIVLAVLIVPLISKRLGERSGYPDETWQATTPEKQSIDSEILAEGLAAMKENGIPIHSLMIVRHGKVIVDAYFYPYDGSIYHDVASVTKSVTATLIGIAADQGLIDLDAPIVSLFPYRAIANLDARKERITVRHLASHTSGLSCVASQGERTLRLMMESPDWVQYALDLKALNEPGKVFSYCSPGMHLLSAILQEATGMTALEFARANLFRPLGIQDVDWAMDPQGYNRGWGDLALRPPDMARLGYLFLREGRWGNRQIVSREWVRQATRVQIVTGDEDEYGYGWRVASLEDDPFFFLATGRGGQRILVVPTLDAVFVTTGGGFEWSQITKYILAAIVDPENPLPANPGGVERLEAVVAGLAGPPAPKPVPPLPEIVMEISGRTYVFPANMLGLQSVRLDFEAEPSEAVLQLEVANEAGLRTGVVGLDGLFRLSRSGRPSVARGWWTDDPLFLIEYSEGPGLNPLILRLRFEGDELVFSIRDARQGGEESMVGNLEE